MNYHNIVHDSMTNGDGLRVVLFVSGCEHHCKGCQNPETWPVTSGIPFDAAAEAEIFAELSKDYISGITISGGDPLHPCNRLDVRNLMEKIKDRFPDKTIWVYTGYKYEEVKNMPMLKLIDVLIDGEYVQELPPAKWVGSNNQKVVNLWKFSNETE